MILKYSVLVLCIVFATCESAFVDTLAANKCSIKDSECLRKLYTLSFREIAKTGLPEYGIPPFDPYEIKNISISVLGMVDIGMDDGIVKGIKDCYFSALNTTIENFHSSMELTCDITIKGRYNVLANSSMIKNLLGGTTVRGNGYGKVKIEKMRMLIDIDFFLREANDEIFIDWKYENTHYQFEYGKVIFSANNLHFGELDVSQPIIEMLNDNWKFIMSTFAKPFTDTATNINDNYFHKFFDNVPARFFLTDDLRSYLQK